MKIPFVGGAYSGRSTNLNAQVCQNWYLEVDQQEGKAPKALINTPGMLLWCTSGTTAVVRGLYVWKDYLYAVVGATLYKIDSAGTPANVGTLLTSTGRVFMAGGTTHLCVVDGLHGYYRVEAAVALTEITDVDFPVPTSLCYQDGYFIVTQSGTDLFFISASEDASSWDGLDFASAEDTPDQALIVTSHNRELWIFGEESTEVFYNSGDTSFPFSRVAGGVFNYGTGAPDSVVTGYEGMFFLDNKYRVRANSGYQSNIISTPQIEFQIQGYTTKSDAIGYTYTQEGHSFYVLTFPSESKTWCYDITIGVWHTRTSGLAGARHRSNCCAYFNGKVLVGDFANGNIYELDLDTYTDFGSTIQRRRTAQAVHADRKKLFHSQLEIEFEAGVGSESGQASLEAVLTGDAVSSVTIVDGGSGYHSDVLCDETGATWGGSVHGLSLIDGSAFIMVSGVDLSPYAGTEGHSTPYKIILKDSAGKLAYGFIGAIDATLATGSELVTNGDFATTASWTAANCTIASIAGGQSGNCIQITRTSGTYQYIRQDFTVEKGKLYLVTVYVKSGTSGDEAYRIQIQEGALFETTLLISGTSSASWVMASGYVTAETTGFRIVVLKNTSTAGTMLFDTVSVKEVTHVGATGVHIVSAKSGSARNWEYIQSGFNYNDTAYTFKVISSEEVSPQIYFSGGGGSGAVAIPILSDGAISSVTVITGGSGYTSAPTITVAGGTSDPQAMLDWSDDGGHVWGNEHWTGIGAIGEYKNRAVWRRLGSSRERIYRLTVTDAVKPIVIGAHLEAQASNA